MRVNNVAGKIRPGRTRTVTMCGWRLAVITVTSL